MSDDTNPNRGGINADGDCMEVTVIGLLSGGPWDKRYKESRRVYLPEGIAPTIIAGRGGGTEVKVIVWTI